MQFIQCKQAFNIQTFDISNPERTKSKRASVDAPLLSAPNGEIIGSLWGMKFFAKSALIPAAAEDSILRDPPRKAD